MDIKIIVSRKDPVGNTIKRLGYSFEEVEDDVTEFSYSGKDIIVVFSRHESSSKIPSFTVHHVGNPTEATLGGKPETLDIAFPKLITAIYRELIDIPIDIQKTFEATHHGPTLEVPILFVEIGSSMEFWTNEKLVSELVKATLKGIGKVDDIECESVITVFGGPHYSPTASRLSKSSCISHIISKHFIEKISNNVILQAIEKSINNVNLVILDSLNKRNKEKIILSVSDLNIPIKSL
ncbi:D-tyrosyl-tRNA(Tyr) deacylase [Candidatus Acidianus copahuensis]|uniref:D-tyrosyl-tRNA(Tyr) deacylase n=1 Tax=Candidatus Acidianus copahuensis TaxID=1160895 RepID=A0A031LK47_9CREN|nr:D-aminoacyl-tRNA deacylase [Candidatus Acidianus copahuensis]EZQ01830.1 D-tyrosyl-tRNA(Tyr) deacylase [Candidatus Acidianus copahuensis]